MVLRVRRYLRGKRIMACCAILSVGLLMTLLAACGSNYSTVGSSPSPTATPTVPQQVKNCGSLHSVRLLIVPTDRNFAKQDEDCFWQAYQQCQPATFSYTQSALDSGTIHNFSLKSLNGTCTITDKVQHFIAPNPPNTTATYTCSNMQLQSDGLHINSCGQAGNIFIPLAASP